jgi:S-adenosylmethionine:tRNA ribosyltransferase-isomerase
MRRAWYEAAVSIPRGSADEHANDVQPHHWPVEPVQTSDFSYDLPGDLIAQAPLAERDASRLLVVGRSLEDCAFSAFADLIDPNDLVVVNDTRVVKARLKGEKDSGGRLVILLEAAISERVARCQVRASKPLMAGRWVLVAGSRIDVVARDDSFWLLRFPCSVDEFFERFGEVPLPPYIERAANLADLDRYQTTFAVNPGAVAAPTAGLHFTERMFDVIRARGARVSSLTLHVGAGTFQPVRVSDPSTHAMHEERYEIPAELVEAVDATRAAGGRVVAVGTTVVRALEAAGRSGHLRAGPATTRLFIHPDAVASGFRFAVVDRLVTNFHLPGSTLLMLVCAFGGYDRVMAAYRHAVTARYRFYSYGDAMFVERGDVRTARH